MCSSDLIVVGFAKENTDHSITFKKNNSTGFTTPFSTNTTFKDLKGDSLASNKWEHKYEREEAAYPSEFLKTAKYWPPVGRVDNVYGDKNLFCTCPSMDEYEDTAA